MPDPQRAVGVAAQQKDAISQTGERIARVSAGDRNIEQVIARMVALAERGLPLMFDRSTGQFAFTRKMQRDGRLGLSGVSLRYGAIVVLGARHLDEQAQRAIFGGSSAREFAGRLIDRLAPDSNLGDMALTMWAAAAVNHPELAQVIKLLQVRQGAACDAYTVEAAWVLAALTACRSYIAVDREIGQAYRRLLGASGVSGIFGHWTNGRSAPWPRRHVGCFADQVYPIQALARYARATGDEDALAAGRRCADQICALQGNAGQWWWHYDCRNGKVIEEYPVYSVHQDAMAPMALLDLMDAGGGDYSEAIRLGLDWMIRAAEVGRCLIDDGQAVIWRKVARTGPSKITRQIRAAASRVHPDLRLYWLNGMFEPRTIDYESRPYHLGWILHTWLGDASRKAG